MRACDESRDGEGPKAPDDPFDPAGVPGCHDAQIQFVTFAANKQENLLVGTRCSMLTYSKA